MDRVVTLRAAADRQTSDVGGKARGLGRLLQLGLHVPDGFVITADAYREATAAGVRTETGQALPDPLTDAVARAYAELGADAVAVRSSATAEDGASRAFAGMHDTHLNVTGLEDCLAAVRGVWDSLRSERAVSYRTRQGVADDEIAMAVVIQALVPAEVSGVAFTVDPVSGQADRVVIEAAYGLGEAVVQGRVTPHRWVFAKGEELLCIESEVHPQALHIVPDGRGTREEPLAAAVGERACLTEESARDLARRVIEIESAWGAPQDVEWAWAHGQFHFLQARPVTATRASRSHDAPRLAWSNFNSGEVLPDVATPLTWSMIEEVDRILREMFARLGVDLEDHPLVGRVGGRVYFSLSTLLGVYRKLPLGGGEELQRSFGGADPGVVEAADVPEIRTGLWRVALRSPWALVWVVRHRLGKADAFLGDLRRLREDDPSDLSALSDSDLVEEIGSILTAVFATDEVLGFPGVGMAYLSALETVCARWFPEEGASLAHGLLVGQGGVDSAESGLELARLSAAAHAVPAVEEVLVAAEGWSEASESLVAFDAGREFLSRWQAFLAEHGHHTRGEIELYNPRWSERPDGILRMLTGLLEGIDERLASFEARTREREKLEEETTRRLGPLRRPLFRMICRRARRGSALRENIKSEVVRHIARVRRRVLELGRRLAGDRRLDDPSDAFFLERPELASAVAGEDLRFRIATRRREYEENLLLDPPPLVIGDFDPRDDHDPDPTGDVLNGLGVSPGRVTGRARVILQSDHDEEILPGEILVAPFTDPGWAPYFVPAAGIVMDLGGVLSHGSIVAREYGIPAVVNVRAGTRRIRTGQWLRVDGNRGEVTLLDDTNTDENGV